LALYNVAVILIKLCAFLGLNCDDDDDDKDDDDDNNNNNI
jgi:hypothetical protein